MMRHSCQNNGCYLDRHVLKFDTFAGLFPRNMNFTDIDASIEYRGLFLDMEWKQSRDCVNRGQEIYFERKTEFCFHTAIVVIGNAQDMTCTEYCVYWKGKPSVWIQGDIEMLKVQIVKWKEHIDNYRDNQVALMTGEA